LQIASNNYAKENDEMELTIGGWNGILKVTGKVWNIAVWCENGPCYS